MANQNGIGLATESLSMESIFLVGKSCAFLISLDTKFMGAVLRTFDSVVDQILLEVYKLGTIGNMMDCSAVSSACMHGINWPRI